MKTNLPVAILVRVSTSRQENARQLAELNQYANNKSFCVVEVCEESISGDADADDRHGLKRIEELAALAR